MPGPARLFSFALLSLASLLGGCGPSQPARGASHEAGGRHCPSPELPSHVVRFGPGMTPPVYVSGPQLELTPEARAHGSKGTLRARCIVTREGAVQNCILLESAPYMGDVYLEVLSQQHYRPTLLEDGTPIAVQFDFVLNVNAPSAPAPPQPPGTLWTLPPGTKLPRPVRIDGEEPKYTREALCNGVKGEVVVHCVVNEEGRTEQCVVRQTLPYLEKSVLDALATRRYTPVVYDGKARRYNQTFKFTFAEGGRAARSER